MKADKPVRNQPGFTLIETLVAMGIVMILIALALPALGKVKSQAREVQSLSRIRQLGLLVVQYASENDDRVPAIFPPVYIEPGNPPDWLEVEIGGRTFRGAWFTNGGDGLYALNPPPPPQIMRAPGAPDVDPIIVHDEPTSHFKDYWIAACYYATPNYWHSDERQAGPHQWGLQALSDTRYPAHKGLMKQGMIYDPRAPHPQSRWPSGLFRDVSSSVLWADLSASQEYLYMLRQGVFNRFSHGVKPIGPFSLRGGPTISNTEDGIAGRDRD